MYYEEANLSGENILTVLYCAKKYMIPGLKELCSEFLEKEMDHNNVCFILEQVTVTFSTLFLYERHIFKELHEELQTNYS